MRTFILFLFDYNVRSDGGQVIEMRVIVDVSEILLAYTCKIHIRIHPPPKYTCVLIRYWLRIRY